MPNLKIFHEQRSLGEHILQSPPPSLSSLHTLSFGISGNYSTLSSLLERLVLSNLRDLRIDATAKIEHLPQFLSRSSETLRVLKLRVKESESAVVVPLLECVPGVEHLAMRGNAPDALRTLAERVPSTGKLRLLPRLQRLGLWMLLGADEIDEDSLLSLAENRVRPGAEDESVTASHLPSETDVEDFSYLRTLELDIKFIIGTDTLQSLRSLEAKGLEVNRSACEWFFLSSEAEWA
ncbi:hypothetical protein WG66_003820 [Moniliophthora roreri]|nr:hypothetical protein WG66_003820 [Moniliophthora roreri]